MFYGFNQGLNRIYHKHTHHCCSCKHVYSIFLTARANARLYKHGVGDGRPKYSHILHIPHKRLNRLDFSFSRSVFSLLMVNSKRGSSNILILFSGVKSTSKFPALKSKAVFGCFLLFRKFAFLVYFDSLWRLLILKY